MPELPDVEQFRRAFERHAAGRTVRTLDVDPTILRNATPQQLAAALRGRTFATPYRHGKWLIAPSDGPFLLLHFGMTGDVISSHDEPERHRHDRLTLVFTDGTELRYRNMRKLGGAWLAHDRDELQRVIGPLGPDALDLPTKELVARMHRRRGGVKAMLMDQRFVAGIGNLVADEVLWQAHLHPRHPVELLTAQQRHTLAKVIRSVLRESVDRYDYIPRKRSWLSHVRGRPGAACPRCRTPLSRATAAGRTTYFCPTCQPAPPTLKASARP